MGKKVTKKPASSLATRDEKDTDAGVEFTKQEAEVLRQIEKLTGKPVPLLQEMFSETVKIGFFASDGHVVKLMIEGMGLVALPDSIGDLSFLESINASRNQISLLPESMARLVKLKFLTMVGNPIPVLPAWIGDLGELQIISLGACNLESLPESLTRLRKVQAFTIVQRKPISFTTKVVTWLNGLKFNGATVVVPGWKPVEP
jgi:hypothetical protein